MPSALMPSALRPTVAGALVMALVLHWQPARLAAAADSDANNGVTVRLIDEAGKPLAGAAPAEPVVAAKTTDPAATGGNDNSGEEAAVRRARELLYFLREYMIFCRDDAWIAAVRELASLGPPAVPEIIAELDATESDLSRRVLAMSLRAIDDPRGVPALLRALPNCKLRSSDCGVNVYDPVLVAFMRGNSPDRWMNHSPRTSTAAGSRPPKGEKPEPDAPQAEPPAPAGPAAENGAAKAALPHRVDKGEVQVVPVGRSVNEIVSALEKLISHSEGHDFKDAAQLETLSGRWNQWWKERGPALLSAAELAAASPPRRSEDLVLAAGLRRYGPTFPTGQGVKLGRTFYVTLEIGDESSDRYQCLDFDRHKIYESSEVRDLQEHDEQSDALRELGIDICSSVCDFKEWGSARQLEATDLHVWRCEDDYWNRFEDEINRGATINVARLKFVRSLSPNADLDKPLPPATFLFSTGEGGRGIVQIVTENWLGTEGGIALRYRLLDVPPGVPARPIWP